MSISISRSLRLLILTALGAALLIPASAQAAFGLLGGKEGFSASALHSIGKEGKEQLPETLAGAHPYELRTELHFNSQAGKSEGDLRDLSLDLPPGLIENPQALAQCTQAQLHTPRISPFGPTQSGESCPGTSQVGVITLATDREGGKPMSFGVFNATPPPGVPSQLAASPFGEAVSLSPHIRESGGTYAISLGLRDFTQGFDLRAMTLELWGVPWSPTHDGQRGNCLNEQSPEHPHAKCGVEPPKQDHAAMPYLTTPSECGTELSFAVQLTSWQGEATQAEDEGPALEDCDSLDFEPKPIARLSTARTTSSTGFDFTLDGNATGLINPDRRAGSQVRDATLTLANGVTINPSLGAGLGVCTAAQYQAIKGNSGSDCPNDSKIGDVSVESPLFEGTLQGGVFLAKPDDANTGEAGAENPFNTLIALYLVARSPARGIAVKVAGELVANPANGNLVGVFKELPQLPYSHFNVHFRDGQRSPLASPPVCGIYSTGVDLVPWDDPNQHAFFNARFELNTGIGGGPCPSGVQPFAPTAKGGTANRNAGSYTPFYLRLARSDSEQEITSYSAKLPPGLLGRLVGVPYCPEAAIAKAARNSGFAEAEEPSCPEASKIGHTTAGYGLGSTLTYAPGNLYLAGPYGGQPFSVVAIDSATVGPFDLGVVIVRSAIDVDPRTAQVSIDSAASDPIPHIIDGIPIHLRDIRIYIDRAGFTLNPTNCDPLALNSFLTGAGANLGTRADDPTAAATVPFQVSNCSAMGFKPALTFRLNGQARRGDYPRLSATYRPRSGDANSREATVTLPNSLFLAQGHIDTVCTKRQFAAKSCPSGSVYGKAEAISPLLGAPLKGPVYLRASEHTLPDMVAAISGGGVSIEAVARIDSYKGGLRATFTNLPDAPVKRFTMSLYGNDKGLLEAAGNLCTEVPHATARLVGQNNKGVITHPALVAQCEKAKKKSHGKRGGGK